MNMFQNAERCLSKQVLSQHLTPQLSSIFPLSHLCLHKTQTHQGRQNCSAAQHTAAHNRCSDTAADSHKLRVSTALSIAFLLLWYRCVFLKVDFKVTINWALHSPPCLARAPRKGCMCELKL